MDLECNGLEAVWVEITVKSKTILVGGFYRPSNSDVAYYNLILESIDRADNTDLHDVIITGDFNYDIIMNIINVRGDSAV